MEIVCGTNREMNDVVCHAKRCCSPKTKDPPASAGQGTQCRCTGQLTCKQHEQCNIVLCTCIIFSSMQNFCPNAKDLKCLLLPERQRYATTRSKCWLSQSDPPPNAAKARYPVFLASPSGEKCVTTYLPYPPWPPSHPRTDHLPFLLVVRAASLQFQDSVVRFLPTAHPAHLHLDHHLQSLPPGG